MSKPINDYTRPPEQIPLTPADVARMTGLPGPWTVRRLEARAIIPPARRTSLFRRRFWTLDQLPELVRCVQGFKEGATK